MHKILDEIEFWPGQTTDYGVSCPGVSKKFPIDLLMGKWYLHASSFIFDRIIIKGIKAGSSLILGQIRPIILELLALE